MGCPLCWATIELEEPVDGEPRTAPDYLYTSSLSIQRVVDIITKIDKIKAGPASIQEWCRWWSNRGDKEEGCRNAEKEQKCLEQKRKSRRR
jgi:hypothetical protein